MEIEVILERCQGGDDLAWEALVRRYQSRVFSVAIHYMRDREEARDAAQEVFIKLYRALPELRDAETFLPWLLRMARNCCVDRLRRNRVRQAPGAVPVDEAVEVRAPGLSPEGSWMRNSRHRLVHEAMGHLSPESREMILLKEIQQFKLREIAEMLKLPMGTVKSRSHRARVELAAAVRTIDPSYGA